MIECVEFILIGWQIANNYCLSFLLWGKGKQSLSYLVPSSIGREKPHGEGQGHFTIPKVSQNTIKNYSIQLVYISLYSLIIYPFHIIYFLSERERERERERVTNIFKEMSNLFIYNNHLLQPSIIKLVLINVYLNNDNITNWSII